MNPPDQRPERLERLKKILAESYPQTAAEDREPLPPSVLEELEGKAAAAHARGRRTIMQRLSDWFRTPQLAGLAAVVALLVVAIMLYLPDRETTIGGGGGTTRSGGGEVSGPAVIVLHQLTAGQVEAVQGSGFFRAGQLVVVEAGSDLSAILAERKQANLVLVDGETGRITAPFAANAAVVATDLPPNETELATAVLDVLAELPEAESGGTP